MLKKLQNNKGFTIIEVMIVLAIAGLIILIVLLAVPALQRNGRNTTLKADASAIAGAITEFRANNDGTEPTTGSEASGGTVTIASGTPGAPAGTSSTAKIQGSTNYTDNSGAQTVTAAAGSITVLYGAKCPTTVPTGASVTTTASARSSAVIYFVEQANGGAARCIDA